jgi:hypothetical protein
MAGLSKKMHIHDEDKLYELFQENEYSDISHSEYSSDSEINVKISSSGEQSANTDEGQNASNNSSMQPELWVNSGAEWPRFPFTDKPGINVDSEDHVPLEYFALFIHKTLQM